MASKVLVLGSSGMLGREMIRVLRENRFDVATAGRSNVDIRLEAKSPDFGQPGLVGFDYIVNCIGLTKHQIHSGASTNDANAINWEFPHRLAKFAELAGSRVIQIATDCVFSGSTGGYFETSRHDADDVYGITKSRGEVVSEAVMHLRCSIVGRGGSGPRYLLDWVLSHEENALVPGFTNHTWNGVTTTGFANVIAGVIRDGTFRPGVAHLIPENVLTKFELVKDIARAFGRSDLEVVPVESGLAKNMTLATINPANNASLWVSSVYKKAPTIQSLVFEMATLNASLGLGND